MSSLPTPGEPPATPPVAPPLLPPVSSDAPNAGAPPWDGPSVRLLDPYIPPAQQEPVWPVAVGVAALVIGGYGMLMHIAAFQSHKLLAAVWMKKTNPALTTALENSKFITQLNSALCVLLGLLLIAGAIALLRRRKNARRLLMSWAVCRIILALAVAPFTIKYSRTVMQNLTPGSFGLVRPPAPAPPPGGVTAGPAPTAGTPTSPTPPPVPTSPTTAATPPTATALPPAAAAAPDFFSSGMMSAFQTVGMITGVISTCALPIAMILWLKRRKSLISLAEWQRETMPAAVTPTIP